MIDSCTIKSSRINLQSEIYNQKCSETPKRGQGAKRPDRFFAKSGSIFHQIFRE